MSDSPIYGSTETQWVLCLTDHEHSLECSEVEVMEPTWKGALPVVTSHEGRYRAAVPMGWLHEVPVEEPSVDLQFGDVLVDEHGKKVVYLHSPYRRTYSVAIQNGNTIDVDVTWLERNTETLHRDGKVRTEAGDQWFYDVDLVLDVHDSNRTYFEPDFEDLAQTAVETYERFKRQTDEDWLERVVDSMREVYGNPKVEVPSVDFRRGDPNSGCTCSVPDVLEPHWDPDCPVHG